MKIKISKIKERLEKAGILYDQRSIADSSSKVWHKIESGMHHFDLPAIKTAPNSFWQVWNRRMAIVSGLAVLTLALSTGIVHASNNSLPGDLLYPVNLAVDNVREKLIFNPQRKTEFKLKQAEKRMNKVLETSKSNDDLIKKHERAVDDFEESLDTSEEFLLLLKSDERKSEVKQKKIEKMQEKFDRLKDRYKKLKDDESLDLLKDDSKKGKDRL